MKVFIDCEYNSLNGQLLSMALIAHKQASVGSDPIHCEALYFELPIHEPIDQWVADNVFPHFSGTKLSRARAQVELSAFLKQFKTVELIADWPEDIKYFMELLITGPGVMIDVPPLSVRFIPIDYVSEKPHHALCDAKAIAEAWYKMEKEQGHEFV